MMTEFITSKTDNKYNNKLRSALYYIAGTLGTALFTAFFLESLSRMSLIKAALFVLQEPLLFFMNYFIILMTISLTLLTAKRKFFFPCVTGLWIILGAVNRIVQCFRLTPISAMDFYQISEAVKTLPMYLNPVSIILIILLILGIIAGIVLLWRRVKKQKRLLAAPLLLLIMSISLFYLLSFEAAKTDVLHSEYDNLKDAYLEYGFAYCFSNSIFSRGIEKPSDYSASRMEEVTKAIQASSDKLYTGTAAKVDKPNIIMVQLESFFDTSYLKNYTFSENPTPNFTSLKKNYSSGFLTVPVYGAGTVNTEFEVITGMSMEFFGTGEYPYRTVLRSNTCDSIPYNLDREGYQSYVIHNNAATFYNRNDVFPRLGFDYFDSMEYMNGLSYNQIGWAKDSILTDEIYKALTSDEERDYIYTISVQSHGIYPDTQPQESQKIKVSPLSDKISYPEEEYSSLSAYVNSIGYYANELYETDEFVGALIKKLSEFQEPTVVVFYGDHLPPLSLKQEDITSDRHQTEYVLWSNFSMDKTRYDLSAYQLSAYVLDRMGMNSGILTQFHQRCFEDANYKEELKLLQYDLLYGKKYVFDKENPNEVKDMSMGIIQPVISAVTKEGDKLLITGNGFTECSAVVADGKACKTEFITDTSLLIPYKELKGKEIYIKQLAGAKVTLGKSKSFLVETPDVN